MEKNETVEANIKINEQFNDGKIHSTSPGSTEAESANIQMRDRFRGEREKTAEGVSPAFVYTPALELNPEE